MGEDLCEFKLDALEVFKILRKWKKTFKNNKQKLNQSIWIQSMQNNKFNFYTAFRVCILSTKLTIFFIILFQTLYFSILK